MGNTSSASTSDLAHTSLDERIQEMSRAVQGAEFPPAAKQVAHPTELVASFEYQEEAEQPSLAAETVHPAVGELPKKEAIENLLGMMKLPSENCFVENGEEETGKFMEFTDIPDDNSLKLLGESAAQIKEIADQLLECRSQYKKVLGVELECQMEGNHDDILFKTIRAAAIKKTSGLMKAVEKNFENIKTALNEAIATEKRVYLVRNLERNWENIKALYTRPITKETDCFLKKLEENFKNMATDLAEKPAMMKRRDRHEFRRVESALINEIFSSIWKGIANESSHEEEEDPDQPCCSTACNNGRKRKIQESEPSESSSKKVMDYLTDAAAR